MRWGLIADIHANKYALEAVLNEFRRQHVQKIVSLGDLTGGGPHPEEVIRILRNVALICVIGDHDLHVLGRAKHYLHLYSDSLVDNFQKTAQQLSKESLEWLGKRPRVSYWREHIFVHASPFNCFYGDIVAASPVMKEKLAYGYTFAGHTHRPMLIRNGVNVKRGDVVKLEMRDIVVLGSVGWPNGPTPKAHAAIWDVGEKTVQYLEVDYDVEQFLKEAQENGYARFTKHDIRIQEGLSA